MTVIAETRAGQLGGRDKDGVLLFAGVPFAEAPVGERRFKPPVEHGGWDGVREATRFSRVSVQLGNSLGAISAGPAPDWSEDCLYLNVQTPALDTARRPVLFWIHGGGFVNGTGSVPWYDGSNFVRHGDVVVVSINYRLGALGWLHLASLGDEFAGSGNNGLLDQVAALRWVADNIEAFGGDPNNVTIFGESAGGMSVATLLATPAAKGLFHKAIPQSGAAHTVLSSEEAEIVAQEFAKELGGDLAAVLDAPPDRLLEVQGLVAQRLASGGLPRRSGGGSAGLSFSPVVDGRVLPQLPIAAVRDGAGADISLMTGTNRDEWKLFGLGMGSIDDDDTLRRRLGRTLDDPDRFVDSYRRALPEADHDQVFGAIMTDRMFRVPAIRLAEAQSQHQPENSFMYLFEWASSAFGGRLGACHALEIPFVFDNLGKAGVEMLTGPDAPQSLASVMHAAWIAFAKAGSPGHEDLAEWSPYDADDRATMMFGSSCAIENDPGSDLREVWAGVL